MSRKIDGSGMNARMVGRRCASSASLATPRASSSWSIRSSGSNPASAGSDAEPRQRQGWPRIECQTPQTWGGGGMPPSLADPRLAVNPTHLKAVEKASDAHQDDSEEDEGRR